jgi:hypothetical protein
MSTYSVIPPIVSISVEYAVDRIIARDTARRVASALGFVPAEQAQLSVAAAKLAESLLATGQRNEICYSGVLSENGVGLQMTCAVPWLTDAKLTDLSQSFERRGDSLVSDLHIEQGVVPAIVLTTWRDGESS